MSKWVLAAVLVAAALWSGWWVLGARTTERAALEAIAGAEARGWTIGRDALSVGGFPNRFDVTLERPRVASPRGWVVEASIFRAFALAYRPNHVIAVAPPDILIEPPLGAEILLTSGDLRASAVVTASTEPVLARATVAGERLALEGGVAATLAAGQVALRRADAPTAYDLALSLSGLAVGSVGVETVGLDALVTFDRPLGAGGEARLDTAELRTAEVVSGDLRLTATGTVSVRDDGLPFGEAVVRVHDVDALVDRLGGFGLPPMQVAVIGAGLRGAADADGVASVPVAFRDGTLSVLGFPVAPLPRLPVPGR